MPYRSGKAIWSKIGNSKKKYVDEDNLCIFNVNYLFKNTFEVNYSKHFQGNF